MPAVPAEVERKRLQLKRELFNLLLQHSDGILKINVWSLLAGNSKMKLTNSEFRIGSMDGAFRLFEDMIHEEHRDGKTFICLNRQFSWESNIPLQNRGLKTRLFENSSQQSLLGAHSSPVIAGAAPVRLSMLSWPHLGASGPQASRPLVSVSSDDVSRGMQPSRVIPGQMSCRPIPSLLPTPTLQQCLASHANPTNVDMVQSVDIDNDMDSSESEDDDDDGRGTGEKKVAYTLIKSRLVKLLTETGPMKRAQFLREYQKRYHGKLTDHAGINGGKLLSVFGDVIERFRPSPDFKKTKIRVKPSYLEKKGTVQQWGQGVGQNLDKQRSASSSSTEMPSRQGQQVVDLTGENVIDLTADSSFISLGLERSATSQGNAARRDDGNFISLEMNSPAPSTSSHEARGHRDNSLEDGRRSQQGRQQHHYTDVLSNAPAPYESLHATATPLNKKKFEEKELNVAPIRRTNHFTRPTKDQIDNVAQECIEILAESNCYVSCERIEKLLLQRFQARSLCDIGPRYIDQIGCVNEHNRLIAKVNAYIQAFVKVRSICTLHELKDCLKDYAISKDNFSKLNIGPLQRLPIVYQMFKFPTDFEEIPEITTLDILEHLRNYLTKKNKWTERTDLQDFMEYLVEEYDADDAFQLGVRIRSLPLGLQVLKKAQRDTGQTRRSVVEGFKDQLRKDIETVFQKFRTTIIHTTADGTWEVRNHYLKLRPEMAILEIFQNFKKLILSMDEPSSRVQKKQQQKIESAICNFLESVKDDVMAKTLFHLAICVSNSVLEESAMEILAPPEKEGTTEETAEDRVKPPKATLVTSLKKYLERCLQHGTLTLALLDKIEEKITEESKFPSFAEIGYGRFLQFTIQEAKGLLDDCGGTSVGSGSGGTDSESGYKPTQTDILSFIHQCVQCGKDQEENIDVALCNQFNVKEVKELGYGKITNLMTAAMKPGQHKYQEHSVVFEVAVGTGLRKSQESKIGMLGHQTKEAALACLHNCPLMVDIATWSHWSLVFEPEFGKLKDFIQKYGGTNTIPVDGGKRLFTYHIAAMETKPGVLLKLTSHTSTELFEEALAMKNARNVCGQLMSLIVANKGLTNSPLALLANQMRSYLFAMHASDPSNSLPGAPPAETHADETVKFVLNCLVILPVKSCVSLANQIFLEPLGQVVGSSTSKFQLLSACETAEETDRLQELGCMLGVGEWTNQIQKKCQIMMADMEIVPEEEAELIVLDDNKEESDVDRDVCSVTSILSSILLDEEDDDVQIVSVEKEAEVKEEVKKEDTVVELSTGDEDTQTEPDNDEKQEFTVVDEINNEDTKTEEQTTVTKETEEEILLEKAEESEDSCEMEIMTEEERLHKECEKVINIIRREEFGIGIELNEDGQKLKKVQDERLGRSLDRLSKDLYSKDTHFVLELIQNADDNDYPESMTKDGQNASVKFVMQTDGVIVLNNESGFLEKNIRALCDVGRSTKGKHKFGYIGQKGIGFKSVFRVTDRPEVHSNGYHICFDVLSGPMGYILPHWIEDTWEIGTGWTTKIILPLKEEMKIHMRSLAARFNDIHPSLLLFLHRLREITIDNRVENSSQVMRRKDLGNDVIEIEHNNGTDRWLVVKKMLDASKISLQAKSGVEVESTEIALAFPLSDQFLHSKVMPPKQPVFAFLPLRSYGFRFIIQADFDVPSSREDVDRDSAWNQWIRNEIHKLFIESLEVFKNHDEFKEMKALITFLQFIPMEDEILDFFRPVSTHILKQIRAKPCMPTQPNSKGVISWKLPTQVITVRDSLVHEVVPPEFLQHHLDLFFLHREVADVLNPTLIQCLGIESMTTSHLLQIGKVITVSLGKYEVDSDSKIILIAKWLACVYRSLDEFHDNQEVFNTLMTMKIIPLASKEYVALEDNTVFFPITNEQKSRSQYRDPMTYLQEDMNTIHPWFLSVPDNEVNSQVQKLLTKLSVCQLSPSDVINRHILPVLKSDMWKTKGRETLISYLVYIKEQTEKDASLVNMDELANVAIVMTNQGKKIPKRDNVHFTPIYGNRFNLQQTFPGYDWCLIDSVYIQNVTNNADKQRWHKFFSRLGVTDFITIRHVQVELDCESVKESPWAPVEQLYPEYFSKGCVIEDFSCDEIRDLLKFNKIPQTYELQMKSLCEYLDQFWDTQFSRYTKTKLVQKDKDTKQEREVESSLSIWLKNLDWLPAIEVKAKMDNEGVVHYSEEVHRMIPSSLYYPFSDITKLLSYTVKYVDMQFNIEKSTFAKFLGLKFEISLDDMINSLKQWGHRSEDNTPSLFVTSHEHIQMLYHYLAENLNKKQIQDLMDKEPVIFVPVQIKRFDYGEMLSKRRFQVDVAGQMLCRQEVWWEDRIGLFQKHHNILTEIHADIGNKHILSSYQKYVKSHGLQEFFKTGRIDMCPDMKEYAELLVHLTSAQSRVEQDTLQDVMKILSVIGEQMYISDDDPEIDTKKMLIEGKKKKVMNIFKGQNIIATKRRIWTSLGSNPLMADNKEYEQIFQENENVHFVLVEENIRQRIRRPNRNTTGGPLYNVNQEAVMDVLRLCGIENLTDVVEEEIITEMYRPCPRLQRYMVQCVPLLQKFLYNNYNTVYQDLILGGMVSTLTRLQCFETDKLEVRYWFKCDHDIYAIRPESCTLKNDQFICHKPAVESFGEINKVIARAFSNNDITCLRELRNFLTDIHSCITGQTSESLDTCLTRYSAGNISNSEEIWTVPAPILPEPVVAPVEIPEEEVIEEEEEVIIVAEEGLPQGPKPLKAWPPMSDTVDKNLPPRTKTKRDDQGESKVWPPPKAPDYMKSVKDLPSGVKVVHEGEKPEGGDGASQYATEFYRRSDPPQPNTGKATTNVEGQELPERLNVDGERPAVPQLTEDGRPSTPHTGHPGQGHTNAPPQDGQTTHSGGSNYKGDGQSRSHQGDTTHTQKNHGDEQMTDHDGTPSGKRRHVSGGSDSMSQPSAKRPAHRIGMPVWEKELGEYEEEELASGEKLKLPMAMMFDNSKSSEMPEIGRLGELTVYQYLLKELDNNPSVTFVNWCNEDEELGHPYDFEVGVVTEENEFTVYIEVKSTLSDTKEIFEISYPQIKFAQENKDRFHVYRIFNACTPDKVRLVRIQNLAEKINEKQVRLCLLI